MGVVKDKLKYGDVYGNLTVIKLDHTKIVNYNNRIVSYDYYLCKCSCGNYTLATRTSLVTLHKRSCGCLQKTKAKEQGLKNRSHGLYKERIYFEWKNMLYRCYKIKYPYYKHYGERGIKVCDLWKNSLSEFMKWSFENGYKEGLTIDRIDVNGDYCPQNCRWVTRHEQTRNTTRTIFVNYCGEKYCLKDLCSKLGFTSSSVRSLMKNRNMSAEEAIDTKLNKVYNKHTNTWENK